MLMREKLNAHEREMEVLPGGASVSVRAAENICHTYRESPNCMRVLESSTSRSSKRVPQVMVDHLWFCEVGNSRAFQDRGYGESSRRSSEWALSRHSRF